MASLSGRERGRLAVGALLLDASATLPAAIAGAVSVFIREDLGLTDQQFGLALSVSFLAGAVVVVAVRGLVDSLGWRRLIALSALLGSMGLVGVAIASGPATLILALLFSGAGVALMMPGTNLLLVSIDGPARLANLLAVKQASVPIAILLAGLAVTPVLAVADWRALFLLALVVSPGGLLAVWKFGGHGAAEQRVVQHVVDDEVGVSVTIGPQARGAASDGTGDTQGLATAAVGVAIASTLPGALTAYLVISLVASGLEPASAALLYGSANIAGVSVRILAGLYATRFETGGFLPVATMMILGGSGALLLGSDATYLLVIGSSLAFGLGWGWPGLLFFAVMKARPTTPAAASAIVHAGGLTGAAVGPLLAGAAAVMFGWTVTWGIIGALAMCGGALVLVTGRRLVPPRAPLADGRARR